MVKEVSGAVRRTQQLSSKIIIIRKIMSTSFKESVTKETRLWIAVIAVLLLAEVGMHQFGHQVLSLWGLLLAAFLFVAAAMSFRHYRRIGHFSWIIVTGLLTIIGLSIGTQALGLDPLGGIDLTKSSSRRSSRA